MIIKLFKIKKDKFDDLKDLLIKGLEESKDISISEDVLQEYSDPIKISDTQAECDLDINEYNTISKEPDVFSYIKFAKIGIKLHKDFKSLPRNLLYEKEFWAYLSLTVFKDVVKELRFKDNKEMTENKIKQFYLNAGEISRTGLLFLWVMVDSLNSEDDYEITRTAFEFIDPVKAILERNMSKNPLILRAFVQGIINNKYDSKFKSDKYRSRVPSHISCYASISLLDALDYSELVEIISEQQKLIISR